MLAFVTGVLAGGIHVLSGPDHMAAVAPLALRDLRAGSAVGASWGVGHGGGVLLWMGLSALLGKVVRLEAISQLAELVVGFSLIALGAFALWARERHAAHQHGQHRTAFGMGMLHGTAGAAHFLIALPALGLPPASVVAYAAGYVLSAIAVMAVFGGLFAWLGARAPRPDTLRVGCALSTIAVGCLWLGT